MVEKQSEGRGGGGGSKDRYPSSMQASPLVRDHRKTCFGVLPEFKWTSSEACDYQDHNIRPGCAEPLADLELGQGVATLPLVGNIYKKKSHIAPFLGLHPNSFPERIVVIISLKRLQPLSFKTFSRSASVNYDLSPFDRRAQYGKVVTSGGMQSRDAGVTSV